MLLLLWLAVLLLAALVRGWEFGPKLRRFVPLTNMLRRAVPQAPVQVADVRSEDIRVLQLNMLADGLSGLREDMGDFSRVTQEQLAWAGRSRRLLHEILQYEPDVVTLQVCEISVLVTVNQLPPSPLTPPSS
jgi:mRNA deadenylase 3'-5' endonuclease subunit Ccr4